jgi:hypothetical protein
MTNVSISVANMLKKSWTLAVSVAINISMQLCFVSVHGPREPYFVDEPRSLWTCIILILMLQALELSSGTGIISQVWKSVPFHRMKQLTAWQFYLSKFWCIFLLFWYPLNFSYFFGNWLNKRFNHYRVRESDCFSWERLKWSFAFSSEGFTSKLEVKNSVQERSSFRNRKPLHSTNRIF